VERTRSPLRRGRSVRTVCRPCRSVGEPPPIRGGRHSVVPCRPFGMRRTGDVYVVHGPWTSSAQDVFFEGVCGQIER
jgi:hypothetical protein